MNRNKDIKIIKKIYRDNMSDEQKQKIEKLISDIGII